MLECLTVNFIITAYNIFEFRLLTFMLNCAGGSRKYKSNRDFKFFLFFLNTYMVVISFVGKILNIGDKIFN